MVYRKLFSARLAIIFVVATTITQVMGEWVSRQSVLAQSFGENPESFPIPASLPDGTTLRVDGSTSMQITNETLESRFEAQFPNADVELNTSRTDEAIAALLADEIDLVGTGRPLTEEQAAQGLVETPITREKLAIIIGSENTFQGDLTFEQFAGIFRGEIVNWSELGGPDLPIRLIDRPDYSDTRRALSTYQVFEGQPFTTSSTAAPVDVDETDAVIAALGADGIGYAVFSQVNGRNDAQIVPMHGTRPDNPSYPYSQHRAFVHKEDASPAVLAFLGFATTPPGEEVIDEAAAAPDAAESATGEPSAETAPTEAVPQTADPAETDPAAADPAADPAVDPEATDAASDPETTDPATDSEAVPPLPEAGEAVEEPADAETTAQAPATAPTGDVEGGGFPWWVLGIPLLGGLLWWFLKGMGDGAPAAGTGAGAAAAGAGAVAAAGAAAAPIAAATADPRIVLTPRDAQSAYAYWEIPDERPTATKEPGNREMKLRLYDVTDRLPGSALPNHTAEFDCVEPGPDLHVPIETSDRDYVAELGYQTTDNRWIPITQSDPVRVPAASPEVAAPPATANGGLKIPGAALGGAAVAVGAAAVGAAGLKQAVAGAGTSPQTQSRMVLTPRNDKKAYAYWEISETEKAALKAAGGQDCQLRVFDVTGVDLERQPANSVLTYDIAATDCDRFVPLPDANHDYVAAIGYRTQDAGWLEMARSAPMRPATILESVAESGAPNLGAIAGGAAAVGGLAAAGGLAATAAKKQPSGKGSKASIQLTPQPGSKAQVTWEVPDIARAAAKQHGGQQRQVRLYDITGIDPEKQPPHRANKYVCSEASQSMLVAVPQADRDYVAEIGYEAPGNRWLRLARSAPARIPASNENGTRTTTGAAATGLGAVGLVGAAATAGATKNGITTPKPESAEVPTHDCAIATVKVHSRHHTVQLDESQMQHIQNTVAATHSLEPGLHVLCIRNGAFNYGGGHPGEPFVLLWIYGGTVINQKTGVPVSATWSTLNGYADTLTLEVQATATLCAFFLDTYPDDNTDEVTLSIIRL